MKTSWISLPFLMSLLTVTLAAQSTPRNIGVVDVAKVFDEYYKVKEAKERMGKSQKIFKEEMEIFQKELKKLVDEFNEIQTKLKNPNLDSEAIRKQAKVKEKSNLTITVVNFLHFFLGLNFKFIAQMMNFVWVIFFC